MQPLSFSDATNNRCLADKTSQQIIHFAKVFHNTVNWFSLHGTFKNLQKLLYCMLPKCDKDTTKNID